MYIKQDILTPQCSRLKTLNLLEEIFTKIKSQLKEERKSP